MIRYVIQQKSCRELFHNSCTSHTEKEFKNNNDCIRYLWKIRFVPKIISVRYLASTKKEFNSEENINHLKYTREVLKYLRRNNSHLMGISTFNRIEMHRRWQDYCHNAPEINNDNMTYFLVRTFCRDITFLFSIYREVMFQTFMIQLILIILIR